MYYNYYLGFIFSFICSLILALSTFSKDKKNMTKYLIINPIFGALSNFFLCSYTAVVSNIVNLFRNILMHKRKLNGIITTLCVSFYVIFGIIFNTIGIIGVFPILASSSYAIFCYKSNSPQAMRYGLILNMLLWGVHDIYIRAYPSVVMELLTLIITVYNVFKCKKYKI